MNIFTFLCKFPLLKRFLPSLLRNLFILFGKEQFKINFKKLILETNIRDPHDREIYFTQKYEEKQFNELIYIIEKNHIEIFLDVGANSGIYSLLLSNKFDNLIIEAFEPIRSTYQKFLRNIENNKLTRRINVHNLGLSNKNKSLKMQTNIKFGYKQSAAYSVSEIGDEKAEFKLADELLNYKKKNILIKIDTEGHEKFVLEGMQKLIKNNNIFLQLEIWSKNFKTIQETLNSLDFIFLKKIEKEKNVNDYFFFKE